MTLEEVDSSSSPPTRMERSSRYLVLSGAKVNAGDFLIRRRSLELISSARPGARVRVHERWRPLNEEATEWADAVLLCGGPALQPHLYPGIYPLMSSLDRLDIPIIGVGLGWKGVPGDRWSERTYHFTERSRRLLRRMERDGWAISCRDPATERVLNRWGIEDTLMTGDPAWFDLERIGLRFETPPTIDTLLFSMPASPVFFDQAVKLVHALEDRGAFRRILACFNHGWTEGEHLGAERAAGFRRLRDAVTDLGAEAVDLSGDIDSMLGTASRCDLHIGYRLHSHLHFLSMRRPSILLEEDGRGSAAGEALGLPGIRAWRRPPVISPLLRATGRARRLLRPVQRRLQGWIRADDRALPRTLATLRRHRSEGFSAFSRVSDRIDQVYDDRMSPFLKSLP